MIEKEKEKETNNVIHGWQKFSQMSSSIHDSLCFVRVFLRFALGTNVHSQEDKGDRKSLRFRQTMGNGIRKT